MTEAEFRALAAQGYNRIPLVLESFADLDTPLSLYHQARQPALYLSAGIGRRRRALRALLVHRLAGESPDPQPRARDRGRGPRRHRRAPRRRSAGVRRRVPASLSRGAAARAAAFLRRARRLLRLRHRSPHRAPARRFRARSFACAGRRARHPAAADRGAGGRRQSVGQDLADRLRRSGRAECLLGGARPAAGAAAQAPRAGVDSLSDGDRGQRRRERIRRGSLPGRRRPLARVHRRRRRDAGRDLAAHAAAVRRAAALAVPRAALAQSVAVHVLLRLRRLPRRRRVAGDPGAQGRHRASRFGRSPARGRAARRARPTRRWRPSCSPIRRRSPST